MQNNFYFLYYFFDNPIMRWVRVVIFLAIGLIVYFNIENSGFVIRLLPLYFLLILQEFFIHFKLENSAPQKNLNDHVMHPIEAVEIRTRACLERNPNVDSSIKNLANDQSIVYFNKLLNFKLDHFDLEINEEELLLKAKLLAIRVGGLNIHAIDIYVAALLLLDAQNKVLFQRDIKEQDVVTLLAWTRRQFRIDMQKHTGLQVTGSGAFDFFIYGWSQELSRYASNFTNEVLSSSIIEPIGRSREYDLLITALSKNSSSNALLVGDVGVGKNALIVHLVVDSNLDNLPKGVANKLVFKLYPERLLSGINNEGELEERIISLFSELLHAGNIIVYIPNIENIFGGGGIGVDFSGVLVEYLKSSRIKIIGSTTKAAFKEFIYNKQEIKSLFDVIEIEEPDNEATIFMILEKAKQLEVKNRIKILFSAVKEALKLSDSYANDGSQLPGRAIRLLEDVVSFCTTHGVASISEKEVVNFIEQKTQIVLSEPSSIERDKLLNLEATIHKSVIAQDDAVKAISNAMRRVRSGIKDEKKPIASFLFLGPTGVGKTETAKALALSYFGSEEAMIRLDMTEYQNPNSVERFLGSGNNQQTIVDKVLANPFSEILLDEFEKAHPSILDLFLQILDEGRLTDNLGRIVSFNNTIIIATSNAGSEFIRELYREGALGDVRPKLVEKILTSGIFKPELINRFDDVIAFKPLEVDEVVQVAKLFLEELIKEISEKQIILSYDLAVCEFIANNAYSVEFGARNIKRFIEQSIENQLSKLILSDQLKNGGSARIEVLDNKLIITL